MSKGLSANKKTRLQCVLVGALLGAAAFLLLYGHVPLDFRNVTWLLGGYVEKDITQHYTGWLFYRASDWAFPIGNAMNMNWPPGGYVGFADSIPLAAVFFKLLSPLLPATFQYFGPWAFGCSVLQGAAAALLLGLFTNSRVQNALFSLVFIFAPVFLDRQLRHSALGAQWLILLALYFYFKLRRENRGGGAGLVLLSALAITIHPYFVPMVLAIAFALALEQTVQPIAPWKGRLAPAGWLLACLAAVLATGFVFGAFSGGSGGGSTPYGYFSMNLNALFNPSGRGYHWSLLLPAQNQIRGNYDGFNYLGLGLLLALAAAGIDTLIHLRRRPVLGFLRRRFGILLVCACLTAFAVSHEVTAQGRLWFTLPLPQQLVELAGILRSSGRMFYPVWYLLALTACVWLARRLQSKVFHWQIAAAGLLAAVQLLDLSPALLQKHREMHPYVPFFQRLTASAFWAQAAGAYTHMASLDEIGIAESIETALWAAQQGMTTDDSFTARYDPAARAAQVEAHKAALRSGAWATDTLYITSRQEVAMDVAESLEADMYCALVDSRWFVLAPYNDTFTGPGGVEDLPLAEYPMMILDYSDANWEHGVLNWDYKTVCFLDSAFTRRRIDGMAALRADGVDYLITEVSYRDKGWIMVTLDIEDARVLQGARIEGVTAAGKLAPVAAS